MIRFIPNRLKAWDDRLGAAAPRGSGGRDRVPLGLRTAGELDPSALRACPEQMMGSKSRMQGKVSLDRSATTPVYVGIDVCKDRLDVYIHPVGLRRAFANESGGNQATETRPQGPRGRPRGHGGDGQVSPRRPPQPPCRRFRRRHRQSPAVAAVRRGPRRFGQDRPRRLLECWRSWAKASSRAPSPRPAS